MRQRRFGPDALTLPVLGQGTWNLEADDRAAAIGALRRGLDLGLTHVDTAEMYGHGAVETLLGEALAGRRDEVFLVSKVLPSNASRAGTVRACEQSLRRLKTDRLDLYLLHWPGAIPLAETVAAFEQLMAAGKIRAWGVSNFDVDDLEALRAVSDVGHIACNQVLYHLEERSIEHAVIPWCEEHHVSVVAYSPFGSGSFPSARSQGGRVLADVAARHGVTPHAVALAFLVRRESVFAIPKAGDARHVEANARGGDLALTTDDLRRLDEAFPLGASRSLPMI